MILELKTTSEEKVFINSECICLIKNFKGTIIVSMADGISYDFPLDMASLFKKYLKINVLD